MARSDGRGAIKDRGFEMLKFVFPVLLLFLAASPATVADKPCPISAATIKGAWTHASAAGFFEEMDFAVEDGHRIFNSWLHQRPEISGGTWSFDHCILYIAHPTDAQLSFSIVVKPARKNQIVLYDIKTKVSARYRRIK